MHMATKRQKFIHEVDGIQLTISGVLVGFFVFNWYIYIYLSYSTGIFTIISPYSTGVVTEDILHIYNSQNLGIASGQSVAFCM